MSKLVASSEQKSIFSIIVWRTESTLSSAVSWLVSILPVVSVSWRMLIQSFPWTLWSLEPRKACLLMLCMEKSPGHGHKHPVLVLQEGSNPELSGRFHWRLWAIVCGFSPKISDFKVSDAIHTLGENLEVFVVFFLAPLTAVCEGDNCTCMLLSHHLKPSSSIERTARQREWLGKDAIQQHNAMEGQIKENEWTHTPIL